jgi:hypothetical protein
VAQGYRRSVVRLSGSLPDLLRTICFHSVPLSVAAALDPELTSTKLGDATIANLLIRFGTRLMHLGLSAAELVRSKRKVSI